MNHNSLLTPDLHGPSQYYVENNTGTNIPALTVVALNGMGAVYPQVVVGNGGSVQSFGIVNSGISTGSTGFITSLGFFTGTSSVPLNTSGYTVGQSLYCDAFGNLTGTSHGPEIAIAIGISATYGVIYITTATSNISSLLFADSIQNVGGTVTLVGDTSTPGPNQYYGTNGSSALGYYSVPNTPPGGATGAIQYNNGGVFGGFGSWNGSALTIPGNIVFTGTISSAVGDIGLSPASGNVNLLDNNITGINTLQSYSGAWSVSSSGSGSMSSSAFSWDALGNVTANNYIDSSLTANTAIYANGSNQLTSSSTTATELSYVHGVTSAIQTQLNGKQATLTFGNFTDSTSGADGIVVIGGTGAVIGSGTSISQAQSSASANGYLGSSDWNTFNSKQSALTFSDSLINTSGTVTLVGDSPAPTASQYYGTNGSSILGYYALPSTPPGGSTGAVQYNNSGTFAGGAVSTDGTNLNILTGTTTSAQFIDTGLTANTAVYANGSQQLTSSSTTATELGYVHGVTSAIQTQLDSKLNLSGGTMTGAINMGGFQINALGSPSVSSDAATKGYVDAAIAGLTWKGPVAAYANSNVPLTGSTPLIIDGYTVLDGDLLLLAGQTTASQDGEYSAAISGGSYTLTANGLPNAVGDAWLVTNGTVYANSAFLAVSAVPTATFIEFAGPTSLTFTAPLSITGNTVSISQANTSTNGYLSSTDWNTFNNKQPAGNYITALTGDGTASGAGSVTFTLTTVNSNIGSFGSSTEIPTFAVNAKGLITAASTNVVIAPAGTLTGATLASNVLSSSLTTVGTIGTGVWNGTTIATGYGGTGLTTYTTGDTLYASATNTLSKLGIGSTGQVLTVSGGVPSWATPSVSPSGIALTQNHILVGNTSNLAADVAMSGDASIVSSGALTLNTVNSNTGSFGSSTGIPNFTVNGKGLITAAGTSAVIAPAGTLSGTTLNSTVVSSSLTSVGTITSGTWNGTTIAIANGGTGQTTQTTAFDALSPLTTTGDTLYYNGTHNVRLGIGSTGQVLTVAGGIPSWATPVITPSEITLTNNHILVGNASNVAADVAMSGDVSIVASGATTIQKIQGTTVSGTTGTGNVVFSASPTFTGTNTVASETVSGTLTLSTFTQGSVLFAGSGGAVSQDNSQFFWDDTNHRLGIGTNSPASSLQINDSSAQTASYTTATINANATSSTASIQKTGTNIQSTGTWNGTSALNVGLNVTAFNGTQNIAITTNGFSSSNSKYYSGLAGGTIVSWNYGGSNLQGLVAQNDYNTSTGGGIVTMSNLPGAALISGARVGLLNFAGNGSSSVSASGAQIAVITSAAWTGSSTPANIQFATTASGTTTPTTAMTIASNGNVGIATTTPSSLFQVNDVTAQTTSYSTSTINATATSSTASINKTGLNIQSTGTWNGTGAANYGLNVNVSGGTNNYAALFSGGGVGIGGITPPTGVLLFVDAYASGSYPIVVIKANGGQGADMLQIQNSSGGIVSGFNYEGLLMVSTDTSLASLTVQSYSTTTIGTVNKQIASQTADMEEWQNSSGTVLGKYTSAGIMYNGSNSVGSYSQLRNGTFYSTSATANTANFVADNTSAGGSSSGGIIYLAMDYLGAASASGNQLGAIQFIGTSNTLAALAIGANISSQATGTWSSSSTPANLLFSTTASGSTTQTTAMTIGSNGVVGIGTTSPTLSAGGLGLEISSAIGTNAAVQITTGGGVGSSYLYLTTNLHTWIWGLGGASAAFGNSLYLQDQTNSKTPFAIDVNDNVYIGGNITSSFNTAALNIKQTGNLVGINTGSIALAAQLTVIPNATTVVGEVIQGNASQTADLTDWSNSSGTVLTSVNSAGAVIVGSSVPNATVWGTPTTGQLQVSSATNNLALISAGNTNSTGSSTGGGRMGVFPTAIPSAGNRLGTFDFMGSNVSNGAIYGAQIQAFAQANWSSGTAQSYLSFSTIPASSITIQQNMILWGSGDLSVGNGVIGADLAGIAVQPSASSKVGAIIRGAPSQSADLEEWQNNSGTVLAKVDSSGNITAPTFSSTATQTTLTGSAGTAVCSQPNQGSSYKKVVVYLNGYTDTSTQTYTYPTAFSQTPYVYGNAAGVAGATATTTTVTFTVTTTTGFVFIEGY
jgi:hypothetical protein